MFREEPLSGDSPLVKLDNVVLTPHVGGHSYEAWFRRSGFAWYNIKRVEGGEEPLSVAVPSQ